MQIFMTGKLVTLVKNSQEVWLSTDSHLSVLSHHINKSITGIQLTTIVDSYSEEKKNIHRLLQDLSTQSIK